MKRRYKILLVILAAIGLLVWLSLPGGGPRREVEAYKAQLRARGEKLTMKELAPRTTPEGIAAGKAFTNLMGGYRPPANYPSAMKFLSPGVALMGHTNIQPSEMFGYASNVARLTALTEIFKTPILDFNPDYSNESHMMLLPSISTLRSSAQMLSITALQALHEKDYPTAWSSLIASADFVRIYRNEPIMISQLVRVGAERIAIGAAWEGLQEDVLTDTQLVDFLASWEGADVMAILTDSLIMEKAFGIDQLANERKRPYSELMLPASVRETLEMSWLKWQMTRIERAFDFWRWKATRSYVQELGNVKAAEIAVEVSRRITSNEPFYQTLETFKQTLDNISKDYGLQDDYALVSGTGGIFSRYFEKIAAAETARRLLITAIALKRHHLQHGAYPATLAELTPTLLKQLLTDPWDGKPLRYQLKPDGSFLLYSIGQDGKDDGGDPTFGGNGSKTDWVDGKDVVWPRAATPAEVEKATVNAIGDTADTPK